MATKGCTKCGKEKPADDCNFGHTPSGNLRGECRACVNARQKSPAARVLHRARASQRRERGGADLDLSLSDRRRLLERQGGRCPCCAQPIIDLIASEPDHVVPLARGGTNAESNLMMTHAQCNREKHAKTLEEHWDWRYKNGRDPVHLAKLLG